MMEVFHPSLQTRAFDLHPYDAVVAVARGAEKMSALRAEGADVCIDSDTLHVPGDKNKKPPSFGGGLKAAVVAAVGPKGVDVLFDPVGGDAFKQGLRCVGWGGQVLVIGFASGDIPKLPLNLPLVKNITVHGVYWGAHARHAPGQGWRDSKPSDTVEPASESRRRSFKGGHPFFFSCVSFFINSATPRWPYVGGSGEVDAGVAGFVVGRKVERPCVSRVSFRGGSPGIQGGGGAESGGEGRRGAGGWRGGGAGETVKV